MKYILFIISSFLTAHNVYGQIDKSLVLNGCTDYLQIAETDLLDYNNAISIEAWISPNCDDSNRVIVGKEWCVQEWSYYLSVDQGRLHWRFSDDGDCIPTSNGYRSVNQVIPTDVFTHVAVVHDQTSIKLFVNGIEVAGTYIAGSFSQIFNSNQEFRIGVYKNQGGSFGNYFSGLIDELRVWDIPLNQGMILSNMNNTLTGNESGLILYLDMESTAFGSGVALSNLANVSENLTAVATGFTSETPYFIEHSDYPVNPLEFEEEYFLCSGDDLVLSIPDNEYKEVTWSTGSQNNSISISNPGTYSITIETELCKFFDKTFDVIVDDPVFEQEDIYICPDDTYEFQGQTLTPNSTTDFTIPASVGCDTTLTINVYELPQEEASFLGDDILSCQSTVTLVSPYANTVWNGSYNGTDLTVSNNGIYYAVGSDALGCTFIDTIEVIFDIPFKTIDVEICQYDVYPFNGELLLVNTSTLFLIENSGSCDTNVLVNVLETPPQSTSFLGENIISCDYPEVVESPYENTVWNNGFEGSSLSVYQNGEYYATATDELGCTFLDTITVLFDIPFKEINVEICKDDLYPFNGELLAANTSSTFLIEYEDGCDTTVLINVLETPLQQSSFLGEDIVSCTNPAFVLSPYENTVWNNGYVGSELIVVEEGDYYATATDEFGCIFIDTVGVSFGIPSIEINVEICMSGLYPYNGELLPVNSSTTFLIENEEGCDTSVIVNVFENPIQQNPFLGEDIISCENSVILESPYDNTIWSNGFEGPELSVDEEGDYYATITDAYGCAYSDTINVSFGLPMKEINVEICRDDFYDFNGELLPVNSSNTFLIENNLGCDTNVLVNVLEYPSLYNSFLGDDIVSCDNTLIITSPYENTIWNNGFIGSELAVDEEGEYYASAIDEYGCSLSDTINVMFGTPTKEITVEICKDDFYPFNDQLLEVNSSTTFLIETMNGCDTLLTINIVETSIQESSFLGGDIISCNDTLSILSPYENTIWNGNINSQELIVNLPGVYYATATDELGCVFTDSIQVFIESPSKNIIVEICKDDLYPFQGELLAANTTSAFLVSDSGECDTLVFITVNEIALQDSSFLGEDILSCTEDITLISPFQNTIWNEEFYGNELSVANEGIYYAVATNETGCSFYDSIAVNFETNMIDISTTICKEDIFQYNGELFPPNSVTTTIIESEMGCDTTANITVNTYESLEIFEETQVTICNNEINLTSPYESTIWNNNYMGTNFLAQSDGLYSIEAIDDNGCKITDSIYVEIKEYEVYLPNIISNKSNLNNCFRPVFSDSKPRNYSIQIFDRWGELIFSESGQDVSWCGYFNNQKVASGVYVYLLKVESECGGTTEKIGSLTVI